MMMSNIRSYVAVLYNGEAFSTVGDITYDSGLPEIKEGTAYTSGNKANITTSIDLTTNIAMISFECPNTAEMTEMIRRIKRENLNLQRGTVTLIASDDTRETHVNAFIKNKIEQTYSTEGSITVEICAEATN